MCFEMEASLDKVWRIMDLYLSWASCEEPGRLRIEGVQVAWSGYHRVMLGGEKMRVRYRCIVLADYIVLF